ncbi:MAG: antibiotic biosynthesis monooxygenase [Nitrososphaera sp.]|nr:antibiotic biosynthesis monooxygenase [Nitrososphaera sp.]
MELPVVNDKGTFVVISDIELKKESMKEFKEWFVESNKIVSKFDGFIARRLLESQDGKHRVMVIFRDMQSFSKMHQTPEHTAIHAQAVKFMSRPPQPMFFNVVAE